MAYSNAPTPTTPTYTRSSNPGMYVFDDPNVKFNDPMAFFNGGNIQWTQPAAPTLPTFTKAPAPTSP